MSRVTANKYLASPRGTYELKYFFTAALGGDGGVTHSAEAVRDKIKNLIDAEDPKKICRMTRLLRSCVPRGWTLRAGRSPNTVR